MVQDGAEGVVGDFLGRLLGSSVLTALFASFTLALVSMAWSPYGEAVDPACHALEPIPRSAQLITRDEAERRVVEWLSGSAPGATAVENPEVVASCLTTWHSWWELTSKEGEWYDPELRSPSTSVWVVEVEGLSYSAGRGAPGAEGADESDIVPWQYATNILNAETGEAMSGMRYFERILVPVQGDTGSARMVVKIGKHRPTAIPTPTPAPTVANERMTLDSRESGGEQSGQPSQSGMTEEERFTRAILGCWEAKDEDFETTLMGLFPEAGDLDAAKARFIEVNSSKTMEELDPVVDRHCPPGGHRTPTPAPAVEETQQEATTQQESGQTGQSGPTPTATPAPEPTPDPEDTPDGLPPAWAQDALSYAAHYRVDPHEAVRRLMAQEPIGKFGAALERNEANIFAGLWIQHEPDFRVIAAFTDGEAGEEAVARHFLERLQLVPIEVRVVEATLRELEAAQHEAGRLLEELGIASASGINVFENRAELYPPDRELLEKALEESGRTLPDHVVIVGGVRTETMDTAPDAESGNREPGGHSGRSVPESASPEGVTWVLETLHGEPVIDGTFVWLWLEGNTYEGVDGCNNYGGVNQHGTPVVGEDGGFNPASMAVTAMLCESPAGVMEQADEYLRLLGRQGQTLRVEGDHLEILDWSGQVGLVFVRQAPLAGHPVELSGTAWELVPGESAGEDVRAATLVFLDERHAVGITACRGYVASYRVSRERLNSWESGMTESGRSGCAEEARRQEGQFTEDLSGAVEYSVSEEDGTRRFRIRTRTGRTATFEPLDAKVEGLFGPEWRLTAILDAGHAEPDRSLAQRTDRLFPGTRVTARFHAGEGMSGFGGCNSYGVILQQEGSFTEGDGTFAKSVMGVASNAMDCLPPRVMDQETRFTELIPSFQHYRIYGELLVVRTNEGVVLLFHRR